MGIYRGPGGTGDAVNDALSEAVITINAKNAAVDAQAAAELAANNAATSEANADTSEANAATSAANAATSATNAANSASAASASATSAASSASTATTKASEASTSATNAASSASAASTSASNASTSASTSATQATNASNSASAASTSATNASNSASAAATSATNAANSATSASGSASTATTQASNASTSATNAASSATSASGSASTATTQAGIATTQASNAASSATAAASSASGAATSASSASTSASNAASAQSAAEAARDATLTAYDNFDDRYLGSKTSDPTVDNDGNTLVSGSLYFNSSIGGMKVYTGSAWVAAYISGTGYLQASNNLSELTNTTTARSNLGLGSIATQAANSVSITGGSITGITDIAIADGGTGASSAPAAMANLIGFTSTATAAGTTVLSNTSSYYQVFTGTNTQTITLPVTSTLVTGWSFYIVNNSTGALTVNSSGGNLVISVLAGTTVMVTCILASGTTAASWEAGYTDFSTATGTGAVVLATSPTLVTPALGTPSSGTLTNCTFPTLNQNTTGTAANVTGTVAVLNGGTGATTASSARTNLGATTLGSNIFTVTNPSAITFPRFNADNTISTLDAATFRTAIGAGTSSTTGTVTSVAALTLGTTGTDLSSTVATGTTTPVITLNVPTASATNRGALSAADWTTFNSKQPAGTYVTAVSIASANGFAGTSSGGTTPALTLSTSITGVLKGNGTAISAATSGTDYSAGTSSLATGILKSTTTTGALSIAVAADFPTLNQNTTGTAANVTGTVAIANGGTGATTRQEAMDALAGAVTSGSYLRGNGTDVVMSTIQAADVPTLNQNTTGTAANVTGTVAIANGGTGQTTANAAYNALSPMTTTGDMEYRNGSSVATRLGIGTTGQVLTVAGGVPTWAAATGGGGGFSGATETSSGTDITLTSSSTQIQRVAMTAESLRVILPDATTMSTLGGPVFVISNNGSIPFDVAATGGGTMFSLWAGETVELSLSNKTNSTSGWIASGGGFGVYGKFGTSYGGQKYTGLLTYPKTDLNGTNELNINTAEGAISVAALSSTTFIATYLEKTSGYVYAVIGSVSGSTVSWGTPATVSTARAHDIASCCGLSSTTGLIYYWKYSTGTAYAKAFSVSGTTITLSAEGSAARPACRGRGIQAFPSQTVAALAVGSDGTTGQAYIVRSNGTGSAPTFGAVASSGISDAGNNLYPWQMEGACLSSNSFLMAACTATNGMKAVAGTFSGTTITFGSTTASFTYPPAFNSGIVAQENGPVQIFAPSATEAYIINATGGVTKGLTLSGTTITVGTTWANPTGPSTRVAIWNPLLVGSEAVCWNGDIKDYNTQPCLSRFKWSTTYGLTIQGMSVTSAPIYPNTYNFNPTAALSSTRFVVVGRSTSALTNSPYAFTAQVVDING